MSRSKRARSWTGVGVGLLLSSLALCPAKVNAQSVSFASDVGVITYTIGTSDAAQFQALLDRILRRAPVAPTPERLVAPLDVRWLRTLNEGQTVSFVLLFENPTADTDYSIEALIGRMFPSDEADGIVREFRGLTVAATRSVIDFQVLGSVSADAALRPIETFPTDGQMHLFSTLMPVPSPDGDLKLVTLNEDLLNILVFAVVVVGGLTLLRQRAGVGVLAVGALLTVLILLGVFFPTFSRQIVDAPLVWAIVTIAVFWLMRYYGWVRPRDPDVIARREAYREVRLARIRAKLAPASPSPPLGSRPPSKARSDSADPPDQSGKPANEPQIEPRQNKGGERDD